MAGQLLSHATGRGATGTQWRIRFRSPLTFAFAASLIFLTLFNWRFWQELTGAFWQGRFSDAMFLLNLSLCLLLLYMAALLIFPDRRLLAVVIGLLCPVGAMAAYCADTFGLPVDREMIRNIARTDYREAQALFSYRLVLYALVLGVLPVFLVARSRIASLGLKNHLLQHAMVIGALTAMTALLFFSFPAQVRALTESRKGLQYFLVPGATLQGAAEYLLRSISAPGSGGQGSPADTVLLERDPEGKPLLVFFVIGETARHMSFQLGGYARATNPQLSGVDNLYYFSDVEACATTTAVSVPCMLSPVERLGFYVEKTNAERLVLQELASAGIRIRWRSNNTGSEDWRGEFGGIDAIQPDRSGACDETYCHDEVLLDGLEQSILEAKQDQLIVFHQMGSHGPDYFRRYPPAFETFKPACRTNVLSNCSDTEIRNAYDNTIVYADHLLKAKIAILQNLSNQFDTALIYVSDHGESLGENGVYLHGMPYEIAPDEQRKVPLIFWLSTAYKQRLGIDEECLAQQMSGKLSHANLYHTLLGAMQAKNAFYMQGADLLGRCRERSK